jgi:hypothetical protein
VRQGCPLSPFLFIIALDALSRMFQNALDTKTVEGVLLKPTNMEVMHSLYADDVSLVVRAVTENIVQVMKMLQTFGAASGLYVEWAKTKAAFIPMQDTPEEFSQLGWTWESDENATKLLGVPIAQHISEIQSSTMVKAKLEERIPRCKKRPTVLVARIVLANHFIDSSLWYLLTLWGGRPEELVEMQRQVVNFVWDGHHSESNAIE